MNRLQFQQHRNLQAARRARGKYQLSVDRYWRARRIETRLSQMPSRIGWDGSKCFQGFKPTTREAKQAVRNFVKSVDAFHMDLIPGPSGGIGIEGEDWLIRFGPDGEQRG